MHSHFLNQNNAVGVPPSLTPAVQKILRIEIDNVDSLELQDLLQLVSNPPAFQKLIDNFSFNSAGSDEFTKNANNVATVDVERPSYDEDFVALNDSTRRNGIAVEKPLDSNSSRSGSFENGLNTASLSNRSRLHSASRVR